MVSHLFFYQLALCVLVWFFVMLHITWSKPGLPTPPVPAQRVFENSSCKPVTVDASPSPLATVPCSLYNVTAGCPYTRVCARDHQPASPREEHA